MKMMMTWCHGKYNDDPRTSLKLYLGSPEAASLMNSNTEGGDSSGRKLEREESISEMVHWKGSPCNFAVQPIHFLAHDLH